MKRLLGIICALGIAATTSSSVISCGEDMQHWNPDNNPKYVKPYMTWSTFINGRIDIRLVGSIDYVLPDSPDDVWFFKSDNPNKNSDTKMNIKLNRFQIWRDGVDLNISLDDDQQKLFINGKEYDAQFKSGDLKGQSVTFKVQFRTN